MNALYLKYFAGVRWVELTLSVAVTIIGDLQLTVQGGGKIDQNAVLKALGLGAGVAWAYLRIPKDKSASAPVEPATAPDGTSLPPGVDATGPADDAHVDVVEKVITGVMPPTLAAAAPELAGNIAKELGRVLKRGIRF